MNPLFKFISSIRLTIILLGFSMVVVFFGTLDQVHYGIHEVQRRYFESIFVAWQYPLQWPAGASLRWLRIPMPGGYLLGGLLVINLLAAHFRYYRPSWSKVGIVILHTGVIILLISGFVISALQKESQMPIDVGGRTNYSIDFLSNELVIIDRSNPEYDHVVSFPDELLGSEQTLTHPELPMSVEVVAYYPNAPIGLIDNNPGATPVSADQGIAARMKLGVFPQKIDRTIDGVNTATAIVRLQRDGNTLGTWLVSNVMEDNFPPQEFTLDGRNYEISLRFTRRYKPYWMELLEFRHDRYPGTEIPRNFSSLIRITNAQTGEDRTALIFMNNPLRYEGLTFYQASFANQDQTSILQVVRNPGWLLPYLAVFLVGLGMTIQFTLHLVRYVTKRAPAGNKPPSPATPSGGQSS